MHRALARHLAAVNREIDGEARAHHVPGLVGDVVGEDEPARLLDDAVGGRKAKAGALALFLGGEERLEQLGQHMRRNAAAGILHDQHGVIRRREHFRSQLDHLLGLKRAREQRDPPHPLPARRAAIALDRIARIDRKIHDHLLKLLRIGPHRAKVAVMLDVIGNLFAQQPLDQRADLAHHVGQLDNFGPQRLLAREGEQLARQRCGAVGIGADLLDVVIIAVARDVAQQHEVAGADDRGEHIVEIMRDAAGKLADCLHLGSLRDLTAQLIFLAGVGKAEQHRRLAQPPHTGKAEADRLFGRMRQPHRDIAAGRRPASVAADCIGQRGLVLAGDEIGREGGQSPPLAADGAQEGVVGEQEAPVAVGHGKAERKLREQRVELRHARLRRTIEARTDADTRIDQQQQQRGRLVRACRGDAFFGIDQRNVDQGLRRAPTAFAREEDAVALVGAQEADEILPDQARALVPGGAFGKAGADRADHAARGGDRALDPGAAQHLAEGSREIERLEAFPARACDRLQPPDQVVIAASGAGGADLPAGLVRGLYLREARAPVTPRGAGEQGHRLQCLALHRQCGGRGIGAEAVEVEQVGADHAVGAVGDGDRLARTLDRGDRDAPVGRGKAALHRRGPHPVKQDHARQQHASGQHEGERGDGAAGCQPQHRAARGDPSAQPGEQRHGRQGLRAFRIIGSGKGPCRDGLAGFSANGAGQDGRAPWIGRGCCAGGRRGRLSYCAPSLWSSRASIAFNRLARLRDTTARHTQPDSR